MKSAEISVREDSFKSLELEIIPEEIQLRAFTELNETEENKEKCLEELRILLKGEEDLVANTSDEFLLQFLRAKKFKTSKAFCTLKRYYRQHVQYPKIYSNFAPKYNLEVLEANILNFMPKRAPDDSALWIARIGQWDPKDFDCNVLLRFGLICQEKGLQNPVTQICGTTTVVDLKGFSLTHLFHISPSMVKAIVNITQDCLPIRHKAVHFVNNPSIFSILFSMMKPLISSKLFNRITFHGYNLSSLHQQVPKCLLPEELGGTMGPFENNNFYESLLESEEHFLNAQKYGYVSRKK